MNEPSEWNPNDFKLKIIKIVNWFSSITIHSEHELNCVYDNVVFSIKKLILRIKRRMKKKKIWIKENKEWIT